MCQVQTVLGSMDVSELGYCQFHEHILLRKGASYKVNPALCMDDLEKSGRELKAYASAGGDSLIDAQPMGCGRMSEGLKRLSSKTGIHIISSTGFHKLVFYPNDHWIASVKEDILTELFIHEIETGMYIDADLQFPKESMDAKAGIIKVALDGCGITGQYKVLFGAAAKAQGFTDIPIMIHVEHGSDPLELLEFLTQKGVQPKKMVFCHLDRACPDIGVHKFLCGCGAFVEYDTIGRFQYHSDEEEIKIFMDMIGSGYEDSLLFALDTTALRMRAYEESAIGLDYILNRFAEKMYEAGIGKVQLQKISHDNCVNVFR